MDEVCEECFWYWTDDGKKVCHNENVKALRREYNNEYCHYFESNFLGNPPSRDVGSDYDNGCW